MAKFDTPEGITPRGGVYYLKPGKLHDRMYVMGEFGNFQMDMKIPDPFVELFTVSDETEENIIHVGAIRIRVVGAGNLKMDLFSLDKVKTLALVPLIMQFVTDIEPTRLCNFMSQRAILKLGTDVLDDRMQINRIIIYIRPVYTSYPG